MLPEINPHAGACGCRACEPEASLRWALDATLPLLSVKIDVDDPFQLEELAMAAALAASFDASVAGARALLIAALRPPVDLRLMEDALTEASRLMQAVVTPALTADIEAAIARGMTHGAIDAVGGADPAARLGARSLIETDTSLVGAPVAARVSNHAARSVEHYARRYFDAVLVPSLRKRITTLLDISDPTKPLSATELQNIVTRSFTARGYWLMVANAAVSRSYHYGYLKAAQLAGRYAYRWHSVVDRVTSEVCLTLNGLEFWTADAINLMESAAATDDPEAATKLMPWREAPDLRSAGAMVPPAHPHCRSTLVAI